MKKIIPVFIIALVAVGVGAFYGGMKYSQNNLSASRGQGFVGGAFEDFRNLSQEERQQKIQEMGLPDGAETGRMGNRAGSNFADGKIISKDDQSITVELRDGGSKIIFYSDSTEVGKFTSGTSDDLEIGKSATINGIANDDGSITAQSIQLRPEIGSAGANPAEK